jgi:hypothetical protein
MNECAGDWKSHLQEQSLPAQTFFNPRRWISILSLQFSTAEFQAKLFFITED